VRTGNFLHRLAFLVCALGLPGSGVARAAEWQAFGTPAALVAKRNPWSGFQSKDAILMVVRAEKREGESCAAWAQALAAEAPGPKLDVSAKPTRESWANAWKAWEPWSDDDRESVLECSKFPCEVKLDATESKSLAGVPREARFQKYLELVQDRSLRYLKSQERKEYEFPGDPIDPWPELEKAGFKPLLARPAGVELYSKRVEFIKGQLHVIRQIVDYRSALGASKTEAAVWQRDSYTNHYFDGWGEYAQVQCAGPGGKSPVILQALILEFDLLKKTDIVSVISRGNMKSAIEKHGKIYLDQWYERVRGRTR
jgi:hypothetical protein